MKTTIDTIQSGFHGEITVPIAGTNWRRWSMDRVAVEMTAKDVAAMYAAADQCPPNCTCGGYYTAEPIDGVPLNGAGTYLVDVAWITRADEKVIGVDLSDIYAESADFNLPAVPTDGARDTFIHVRASTKTADLLNTIVGATGQSQAAVIHIALNHLAQSSK